MAARLQYDISVIGEDRFKRVMRGVGMELKALERQSAAVARNARAQSSRTVAARGRLVIPGMGDIAVAARLQKKAQDDMARGFQQIARAAMTAERQQFRERARLETQARRVRVSEQKKANTEVGRGFEQIALAARAADRKNFAERTREERRRHLLTTRHQRQEENNLFRGLAQIGQVAAAQEAKRIRGVHRFRERASERFGQGVARGAGHLVGNVAGLGGTALAIGTGVGTIAAGSAVMDQIEVQKRASKLANQAGDPGLKNTLIKEARGVTGFTGSEALGGLEAFVDLTGNLEAARRLLPELGRLALATGTDLVDLAATAGNAFIPLNDQIKDPTERLKKMREVMAAIAGQGSVGAVEIKDLAKEFAGLAASASRYGGDPAQNLKVMGALAQAARQRGGAESAPEAVTSVARFASDLLTSPTQKALAKLPGGGVNVFTDDTKTQLRGPEQIMLDILEKTGGDLTKVSAIFGERGIRAFQGFAPLYTQAERKKPGTGRAAVQKEFGRLMGAQISVADIEKRAKSREQDTDIKFVEATKKFNEAVGTKLLPVITSLIPKIAEVTPAFAELAVAIAGLAPVLAKEIIPAFKDIAPKVVGLIDTFTSTFGGVGGIIAAVLAKEIVLGGVGMAASGAVSALMTKASAVLMAKMGIGGAVTAGAGAAAAGGAASKGIIGGAVGLLGGAFTKTAAAAAGTGAVGSALAGGAAGLGVGLAAWQGSKLYSETGGFKDFGGGPTARSASGDAYDEMMKKAGITPGAEQPMAKVDATEAAAKLNEGAENIRQATTQLASIAGAANPRRTNPINLR